MIVRGSGGVWEFGVVATPRSCGSIDVDERAAIDRQRNAGNEIRLIGRQKQRGVCDVPRGAHLVAQWDASITGGRNLSSAFAGHAGARIDRHRGVNQSR